MKHAIGSLRFSLDDEGAPYYQQLVEQIQQGIETGALSVGDKLPSSRALAMALGISRSTTSRAYDQLLAEGVLLSEAKRGVFIAVQPTFTVRKEASKEGSSLGISTSTITKEVAPVWRFDSGVDVEVFPTKEWAASMRRSWLNPDMAVLKGDYTTGFPLLKTAIVDYLYRVRGMACVADQVIVTAGSRDSLTLLQHTLSSLAAPIHWWLEEATYSPIREMLVRQARVSDLPVDDEGACLVSVPQQANVAWLTPNRQYPLGMSMSSSRRQQWLRQLQHESSNWWIIEDDYDNEFVYQGRNDVPFAQMANLHGPAQDKVFFVGSFSKVLFRGLRLGFIVAPVIHADKVRNSQALLSNSASLPIQPVVADFMLQGSFDRHINRMRRHYRLKRDYLLALLEHHHLDEWFDWKKPQGGMHVLLVFKADVLAVSLAKRSDCLDKLIVEQLLSEKVHLSALSLHYSNQLFARQGFVFGFSGSTKNDMAYCVNRLKNWLLIYSARAANL